MLELIILVDSTSDIRTANDKNDPSVLHSPTPGPSGTYRNPRRQDSVIPPSIQEDITHLELIQPFIESLGTSNTIDDIEDINVPRTRLPDVSKLENWQKEQLRLELFKLLLSFLNGINQFSATSYEPEAEESMNHLLKEFWSNDTDAIRSRVGERFAELQTAWDRWMSMQLSLYKFQRTIGYFGNPGEEWKAHLRRMERVAHAKASIAFVDMKGSGMTGGSAKDIGPEFDNDLATIFDVLTQVEGCDGVDEFGAIRVYNQGLLAWFS
jgi:hypothetical protein